MTHFLVITTDKRTAEKRYRLFSKESKAQFYAMSCGDGVFVKILLLREDCE